MRGFRANHRLSRAGGNPEGRFGSPGCPRPNTNVTRGNVRRTKGGHSPSACGAATDVPSPGIRLAARNTGKPWSITAIAQPHHTPETYQATYIDRSTRVAVLLGFDTALEPGDIDTLTGYTGTKYGVPTEAAYAAIHLVAKTEAITLDPNYTCKSISARSARIRTHNLDPKTPKIFIHSGGQPQTFAFPNQLANCKPN